MDFVNGCHPSVVEKSWQTAEEKEEKKPLFLMNPGIKFNLQDDLFILLFHVLKFSSHNFKGFYFA